MAQLPAKKLLLVGALLGGVAVTGALWIIHSGTGSTSGLAEPLACSLPSESGDNPGMIWVAGGAFTMGAEYAYSEEGPAHQQQVDGFWMDRTEVTNAQFAEFVDTTGYRTLAERGIALATDAPATPGSAVFQPHIVESELDPFTNWWQFVAGANWRHPEGPDSSLAGREQHPVVHVAYEDALAYAQWRGHSLPSEEQFEFAAQSSARRAADGTYIANTWQGFFPFQNDAEDGFTGSSPVGCYGANALGFHDLVGNVWEWTASPYYSRHDFSDRDAWPDGFDPAQPGEAVAVIKGGSFLCAPNYCMRYRPEARQGQSKGLGTSHIGFRTVLNQQI
jgi:formylglycine-generating enzyme